MLDTATLQSTSLQGDGVSQSASRKKDVPPGFFATSSELQRRHVFTRQANCIQQALDTGCVVHCAVPILVVHGIIFTTPSNGDERDSLDVGLRTA